MKKKIKWENKKYCAVERLFKSSLDLITPLETITMLKETIFYWKKYHPEFFEKLNEVNKTNLFTWEEIKFLKLMKK